MEEPFVPLPEYAELYEASLLMRPDEIEQPEGGGWAEGGFLAEVRCVCLATLPPAPTPSLRASPGRVQQSVCWCCAD